MKQTLKRLIAIVMAITMSMTVMTINSWAAEATSSAWSWPTSVHKLKNDWPNYSKNHYHGGTDFAVPLNTPVYSTCDGEVVSVQSLKISYGKHIKIKAVVNGSTVYMRYCHLNSYIVSKGDKVKSGQLIGYSGSTGKSTGPHLHYEVRNSKDKLGSSSSPNLNPKKYLPGTSYTFSLINKPATNAKLTLNQYWYDLGDTIEVTCSGENATSYSVKLVNADTDTVISYKAIPNGGNVQKFSASSLGIGRYAVVCSADNSSGGSTSSWKEFSVVGAASNADATLNQYWYDLGDTIQIKCSGQCYKNFVVVIDNEKGTRLVDTQIEGDTYSIPAKKLGIGTYYTCCIARNNSGGSQSEWKKISVVGSPSNAAVSLDKTEYSLQDTMKISCSAICYKDFLVVVADEKGNRLIEAQITGNTYNVAASKLGAGKYKVCCIARNNSGETQSAWKNITIKNK